MQLFLLRLPATLVKTSTMVQTLTPYEALTQAIDVAGSQSELARICGVSPTAVWKWVQSSKRLPGEYVLQVEAATGVPRHLLRPDLYPLDLPQAPKRWYGTDRHTGARIYGLDRRQGRVALDRGAETKGAAL